MQLRFMNLFENLSILQTTSKQLWKWYRNNWSLYKTWILFFFIKAVVLSKWTTIWYDSVIMRFIFFFLTWRGIRKRERKFSLCNSIKFFYSFFFSLQNINNILLLLLLSNEERERESKRKKTKSLFINYILVRDPFFWGVLNEIVIWIRLLLKRLCV